VKSIICPQCQKELPDNYEGRNCPHCGAALPATIAPPAVIQPSLPEPEAAAFKMNWWIFFAVFLAPPLLTSIAAFLGRLNSNEEVSPMIAVFGGAASGIACGVMLALRLGRTSTARVLLSLLFSAMLAVVCITLSCFGCLAVGYRLNFH
jgi:hypothetical protein